jgi:putative PIN family toxin of toxin-antitoxin system
LSPDSRVLVDANILLSYLLKPTSEAPPAAIIHAAFVKQFRLLVAAESLAELRDKVVRKPYLSNRISSAEVQEFVALLGRLGDILPELAGPIERVVRDRKDDYLLAQADRANADVLVTGDQDLLTLGFYKGIWIMSPAEFVAELEASAAR